MSSRPPLPSSLQHDYLAVLNALSAALESAQPVFATANPGAIEQAVAQQQILVLQLQQLASQCGKSLSPAGLEQPPLLFKKIAAAEDRIRRLNRTQAAYLRRAQRTVTIFSRILSTAPTYSPSAGAGISPAQKR